MEKKKKPAAACANCGATLVGKFCHECGEKRLNRRDLALPKFFREVFAKFTHLDSRLLRSLKWLVLRPGFLSAEYLRGRRKRYAKPLSLFFIINLLYFLSIGANRFRTFENPLSTQLRNPYGGVVRVMIDSRFTNTGTAEGQVFEREFDQRNHTLAKSMLLLIVPMLAAWLWLLYRSQGFFYGEHLITSLHFLALMIVQNMLVGIVFGNSLTNLLIGPFPGNHFVNEVAEPMLWVWALAFFTLKNVYAQPAFPTALKSAALAFLWLPTLIAYRFIVFLATFYTV
ncbi:MAG: DUF3667 domain-containing protein [Lewinellaceae bacterium]|nr:DUF3667 domain-containing protein [Lewinellaceae bacterium]